MTHKATLTSLQGITGRRKWYDDTYIDKDAYSTICTAKAQLLTTFPFWGYMGLDLVLVEADIDELPTMATDGYHIFYNPKFVHKIRPMETMFVNAHEVSHCIYGHTGGEGKINREDSSYDHELWGKATDYRINGDLKDAGIGEFPTTVPGLYNPAFNDMCAEEIYRYLVENPDQQPSNGTIDLHINIKIVADGEENTETEVDGNNVTIKMTQGEFDVEKARWEQTAHSAMATCKMNNEGGAGGIPVHMARLIGNLIKPKVHWKTKLRKFVSNVRTTGYSFALPDKRTFGSEFIFPGFRRNNKKLSLAIAIDVSGSIDDTALTKFISEFSGIMKAYSKYEIHAFCFEADVLDSTYRVISGNATNIASEIHDYTKQIAGNGGTSFQSIWDFLRTKKIVPKGLIVFTDGYPYDVTWHNEKRYCPTLFVTVGNTNHWKAPFGDTIPYEHA